MKYKYLLIPLSIALAMSFTACKKPTAPSASYQDNNSSGEVISNGDNPSSEEISSSSHEESSYVPNTEDTEIYFITNDTLSNGVLADGEYTFTINQNYKQIYVNVPDTVIIV